MAKPCSHHQSLIVRKRASLSLLAGETHLREFLHFQCAARSRVEVALMNKAGSMNIWSVTAMGIGAMVGAGIFALLGVVALVAGNDTYVAFILGGVVALLSGYSYARLSARYPDAGGLAAYFDEAFGKGSISGTLSLIYLLTIAVTIALVAKAFGAYAAPLLLSHPGAISINLFASTIIVLLLILNIAGSSKVGKAEVVLVSIKLLILALLIVAGSYGVMSHGLLRHATPRLFPVISSVGLTFLAYAGFGMMANAAGSVEKPEQTIPHAIYLAIAVVVLIYVALAIVVVGSVPIAALSRNADTAVAVAARPVLGSTGYIVVSVAALLATASAVNAWIFTAMQISMTMAKANQLPLMFQRLVWRKGTWGLLLGMATIVGAVNLFDLGALARIASATFLVSYMAVNVAHWRLIGETKASRWLVAIGFLAMLGVLVCFLWSIAVTQPWSLGLVAAFIVGSWLIEFLLHRREPDRTTRAAA
jgi:amino acid transporter